MLNVTSPHAHKPKTTAQLMRLVIYATFPAIAVMTYCFGWGTIINIALASCAALITEATILWVRKKPIAFYLKDYSAIVTALLLALALPPTLPWWITVLATSFAITFAKHLYGGMGQNPFNPAMLGYALVLISYPAEMTQWLSPAMESASLSFTDSYHAIFHAAAIDAYTGATPLDTFKTYAGDAAQLSNYPVLSGSLAGVGWELVNLAFLFGGVILIALRIITWHIPAAILGSLTIMSGTFYLIDSEQFASPLFHLLSGGTMLGAFFIATDPVSAATSKLGKVIYGVLIGVLIYTIRCFGGYPDAVAFAVLLMNLSAPLIDYYSQPRTYGHKKARRSTSSDTGGSS